MLLVISVPGFSFSRGGGGPLQLTSASVIPSYVVGGSPANGYVYLSTSAPAGGTIVSLSSGNPCVTVAATVTVPSGSSSATFPIATSAVTAGTMVTITATLSNTSVTTSLLVEPLLDFVTFNPNPVSGGSSVTGNVTLYGPAPTNGAIISLSSSDPSVTVPTTVTVPAGSHSTTFPITTSAVATKTTVTITATLNNTTVTGNLVVGLVPASLSLSPSLVVTGNTVAGSVTLNGFAPDGGVTVALSSSDPSAVVPQTVTVPVGYSSTNFTITTTTVTALTTATITATCGGASVSQPLQVSPLKLVSFQILEISPASVIGGTSVLARVTLNGNPDANGATVSLSSSDPAVTVPSTLLFTQDSYDFSMSTSQVNQPETVTVSASLAGSTVQSSVMVLPPITLTANAASVNASISGGMAASSTSSTLTIAASAASDAPIPASLSLGTLPPGVSGWLSASAATVPPATPANNYNPIAYGKTTVTLYLVVGPNTAQGNYPIAVTATSGSYSTFANVTLTVSQ